MTETVELNGKTYRVSGFDGERAASIQVKTKAGWRTLGGYGRACRMNEWNAVIAHLRNQQTADALNESGIFAPFTCIAG